MQQILDVTSEQGQNFVQQLKKNYPVKKIFDKTKEVYNVSGDQLGFLNDIVTEKGVEIVNVEIGHYGRKTGWTSERNIQGDHISTFRILVHFGNPEAYYYNDHVYAVMPGFGFILSPFSPSEVSVCNNPIQVFHHQGVQNIVPKIRPRQYVRTTLIYTLKMNLDEVNDEVKDEVNDEVKDEVNDEVNE